MSEQLCVVLLWEDQGGSDGKGVFASHLFSVQPWGEQCNAVGLCTSLLLGGHFRLHSMSDMEG